MSNGNIAILTLSVKAGDTLVAHRFVGDDGKHATAKGTALGVTRTAGVANEVVPVDVQGTTIVEASGAFDVGAALAVGATGKAAKATAPSDSGAADYAYVAGDVVVARALEASAGDESLVEVLLIANADYAAES